MNDAPPKYPNLAMTAAVLWIALGTAGIFSLAADLARRGESLRFGEESVAGRAAVSGPLVVLGILILTGVLGRAGTAGAASLSFGAVLLLMFVVGGARDLFDNQGRVRAEVLIVAALGLALFVAGTLATAGAGTYRRWWLARRRTR